MSLQKYIATEMAIPNSPDCRRTSEQVYLARHADAELARLREENAKLQRAVEWCLQNGVKRGTGLASPLLFDRYNNGLEVPAEFGDIIKPEQPKT